MVFINLEWKILFQFKVKNKQVAFHLNQVEPYFKKQSARNGCEWAVMGRQFWVHLIQLSASETPVSCGLQSPVITEEVKTSREWSEGV